MSGSTLVPDKLEGYMLQVRHALFELISLDECIVSVEAYDDVAVETDEFLIAEQTKSVLSSNNPVANRAEVFWKTIYNWSNYIQHEHFPQKKLILKYVVVSSHALKAGAIPNSFAAAKTDKEAKQALENARKEFFGNEKSEKDTSTISQTIKPYIDFCFAPENEMLVLEVISLMEIDIHEDTYDKKLVEKFQKQLIPSEYDMELFIYMLGWVDEQVHQQTRQKRPAFISSKDYREALKLQIRSKDCRIIWSAVSVQPEDCKTNAEIERHDIYIRQLEWIDLDALRIFEAASDFLRTRAEKIAWAEKGLVNEESFTDYYDGLRRLWRNCKLFSGSIAKDDIGKGQHVYAQCLNAAMTYRLLGSDVPSFFGSGSLQALANEPAKQPAIGWHPQYLDLLRGEDEHDE